MELTVSRTKVLLQLAQQAIAEATKPGRGQAQTGRLLGVALWYLCEAASTDPHAAIVPHKLINKEKPNDH